MNVSIISIGDELLIGQVVNTNAAWLGERLTGMGYKVISQIVVPDVQNEIIRVVNDCLTTSQIIILTGGLGPTRDDITKLAIAKVLGVSLEYVPDIFRGITNRFKKINRETNDLIKDQCFFPKGTVFLQNDLGTAPGMAYDISGKLLFSLPGVPYEMKSILENEGFDLIKSKFKPPYYIQETILTVGLYESVLSKKIENITSNLPQGFSIAFLPNLNRVRLRISGFGEDQIVLESTLSEIIQSITDILDGYIFGNNNDTLEAHIGTLLKSKNLTLSLAESCTGGRISNLITGVTGASGYFLGSVIAYNNQVKQDILSVSTKTLQEDGAVSEKTVIEMVKNTNETLKSDICLAVSGIAGPGGGSPNKPVGTIWLACGTKNHIQTHELRLNKSRLENIEISACHGLDMIRKYIMAL